MTSLATNVAKWQAMSHPELAQRSADTLFPPEYAALYGHMHADLLGRLIRVHGTIRTLEQLNEFPFDYLYGPNDMEFWRLVIENFLDTGCLMLHSLINDTGRDVHSLRSFKNKIVQWPWLDQKMREVLVKTLREREFDETIRSVAQRVDSIRDVRIAHRLIDPNSGRPKTTLGGIRLDEVRQLFDGAHALFGALSFGSAYATLSGDLIPATVGGKPKRSCLDRVLDAITRDSDVVREPELRQAWWREMREHMRPEDLRTLNELRSRIGLPEA